jgi:hypothetical protein
VCFKEGHNATSYWHHFDENYIPEEKHTNTTTHRYGVDSNWYVDTGTTDHITRELDKLVIYDKYNGTDQIHTASGAGMNINRIGKAIVSTLNCNLHLNNVLYVPNAQKNLVSVHRLAADNNAFLEFHPNFFFYQSHFNGQCQVCFKEGHNATSCWHHFDADYVPEEKHANTATHRYGVDSNWYIDTGATDHITSEVDKLVIHASTMALTRSVLQVGLV